MIMKTSMYHFSDLARRMMLIGEVSSKEYQKRPSHGAHQWTFLNGDGHPAMKSDPQWRYTHLTDDGIGAYESRVELIVKKGSESDSNEKVRKAKKEENALLNRFGEATQANHLLISLMIQKVPFC